MSTPAVRRPVLLVLASLAAVAPVSTDLYLPGFPELGAELGVGASGVQLTLTAFLVGLAVGQLVMGPLSDRYGRRRPLVASAAVCVAAGVVCALAPHLGVLVVARLVQGVAGAGGMVIGRAVLSDLVTGRAAARAFTLMLTVGGIAPVLAPVVGGLLVGSIGWRGLLWVVAGLCAAMLVGVVVVLPETRPPEARAAGATSYAGALRAVARARGYWPPVAVLALSFAMMMAYISASPFVYQEVVGLSTVGYGLAFGVNAVGLIAAGWVSSRLVERVEPQRLVRACMSVQLGATLTFVALALTGAPTWLLPVPIFVAVTTNGGVMGNSAAAAMSTVREVAGMGSALLGCSQFALGALVSPLVGLGGEESAVVPAVVMATASGAGWLVSRARPRDRRPRRAAGAAATRSPDPSHDAGASVRPR
ncbi:Bcr/CflA family efflux MFS transporter [Nocardioides sp. MAH-18]|uniref:Bcr/CflA family efflux MFS transporter n=1 Tax=Nocardioides agri TaxID=2682843 RepID=A0A6L6XTN3_9ACTN|nr:multidrug effflux MFS transporter [Nocardioides sp. CGMCC 1.13656]MBA2955291.1 multidrug effflux MFS transporter [Nocardioides sp. CGMCC 1.13656]MVQ50142.1 Bcr/CflA family efflux MFS transporter [Nocardioides sp. MAH-18]